MLMRVTRLNSHDTVIGRRLYADNNALDKWKFRLAYYRVAGGEDAVTGDKSDLSL